MSGKSRRHDLPFAAEIISRYPFPKMQLLRKDDRFHIKNIEHILWLEGFWLVLVNLFDYACIFLVTQFHFGPASGPGQRKHVIWNLPGIIFGQGQRYDDLCVQNKIIEKRAIYDSLPS
jgi:hypothetical protein